MATVIISPNMGLPVPTVGIDAGPDWATNVNSCLSTIDGHNHSAGSGVQINPSGLNINSDLPFGSNNATALRSVRFTPQSTALSLATDIGCIYEVGVDLYYNDGNGNQIRITQSGAVTGASGTITGLPSGTASASFSAGTFTFQSATSTPATMAVGPLVIGNSVANSKTVTIAPNASIAANYNFTLPSALPAAVNYMTLDNSGNVGYNTAGYTGSGAVVLATGATLATPTINSATISSPAISNPTFSGTIAGSINTTTFAPTLTWTVNPTAISSQTWSYMRINNVVYVRGQISFTGSGSPNSRLTSVTIPIPTTSLLDAYGTTSIISSPTTFSSVVGSGNTLVIAPNGNAWSASASSTTQISMSYSYTIN